jgi:UDP-GlcNAc:undecaprenyl-phosphate GlcNAc-1-phosphate transferase
LTLEVQGAASFAVAFAIALALTPPVARLARLIEHVDRPGGYKQQLVPIPHLGGTAVLLALLCASALFGGLRHASALGAGAVVLWIVGTVDDRRPVSPLIRVLFEIVAAVALWLTNEGWSFFSSPALDLAATIAWTVGVVNAVNLMDNMNGAAASVTLASLVGIVALGLEASDRLVVILGLALAGACAGFLPYNLRSRIYLGNGGSMLIGFLVAALIMTTAQLQGGGHWSVAIVAVLLVGVPLVDTMLVCVSRRRRGVSILAGSSDHLTHRLRRMLPSAGVVAACLACAQLLLSAAAAIVSAAAIAAQVGTGVTFVVAAAMTIWFMERGHASD